MLRSLALRLIHVDQLETLYLWHGVKCQSAVIWGHGVKRSFSQKCYNSSKLHSMTIRLKHVDQLETYLCYGVKCQSGVIWGHWVKK